MKSYKLIVYFLCIAVIAGFFHGFTSIINPNDRFIFTPYIYISLITILFIPMTTFSILYVVTINHIAKKRTLSPTNGLWTSVFFGLLLTTSLLTYSLIESRTIFEKNISGEIDRDKREAQLSSLHTLIENSFLTFLILSAFLTPLIDFWRIKKAQMKVSIKNFFVFLGLSSLYHLLIFIWGIIIMWGLTIFLFFALWS